ncbi:outer membrane protein assembly factor BamB family protein [Paractinoplanes durhamensis]|uniref:Pyrrolo-quinoline quinone repeat domain-containing protein n=1 Tax=Paractinoplanes durhamensis TaxID=113563 RepID=A0ABQ3YNJ5_9ACTN|nr:PQQ-binding-like beta-propeller repeat protein [Actinoplanes durhamensis]GID99137.1 hypothetical protein Adu01nite_04880 [Actinoplanes durhamensis]
MTTIELGEVTEDAVTPPMPVNIPRLRRAALAVLAAAGLLALGGSAHPPPAGVHPLWSTPLRSGESWSLSADTAYLSRLDDKVSAYNLTTGELRWNVPAGADLSGDFGATGPQPLGDLVLVPADPKVITLEQPDGSLHFFMTIRTTIALDATTGDERWRTSGQATSYGNAGPLLISEDEDNARTIRLRLVRAADGTDIWNRSIPPAQSWTPILDGDRPVAIATVTPDGLVTVYDYATGKPRRSLRLPDTDTGQRYTALMSAGGNLVVMRDREAGTETTVYRPDDLRALWHTTQQTAYLTECGEMVCAIGDGVIIGHDPQTGRQTWQLPGMRDMTMVGPNRMVVTGDLATGDNFLVEPSSGQTVHGPIVGRLVTRQGQAGTPTFLRPAAEPPGRLAVVTVDLADGTEHKLGTVPAITTEDICTTADGYLACVRGGALEITAVG